MSTKDFNKYMGKVKSSLDFKLNRHLSYSKSRINLSRDLSTTYQRIPKPALRLQSMLINCSTSSNSDRKRQKTGPDDISLRKKLKLKIKEKERINALRPFQAKDKRFNSRQRTSPNFPSRRKSLKKIEVSKTGKMSFFKKTNNHKSLGKKFFKTGAQSQSGFDLRRIQKMAEKRKLRFSGGHLNFTHIKNTVTNLKEDLKLMRHFLKNRKRVGLMSFFKKKKALINFKDQRGRNSLHWAVIYQNFDAVEYLIENRAKKIKDYNGYTAFDLATRSEFQSIQIALMVSEYFGYGEKVKEEV